MGIQSKETGQPNYYKVFHSIYKMRSSLIFLTKLLLPDGISFFNKKRLHSLFVQWNLGWIVKDVLSCRKKVCANTEHYIF